MKMSLAWMAGLVSAGGITQTRPWAYKVCALAAPLIPDACACGQRPKEDTRCPLLPLSILLL